MADSLNECGPRDRSRIDVHEEWECRYWSKRFGVQPEELKRAVSEVGDRADDVERYFARRNTRTASH
jgi:uncharacterized protein DUF3606